MKDIYLNMDKKERIKHMGNPGWVAYLSPFTLIIPDNEDPLKVDLDEINSNSYDHGKLCRIINYTNIEESKYDMVICYDGAFAIPKVGRFSEKEKAVDFFNRLFCKLLLGGFYCEAIDRRDVVNGYLHEKRLIWPTDFGQSASSHLHSTLRMRSAGSTDRIILSNPSHITISEFHRYKNFGDEILSIVTNLTPTFLIRGVTEIKYRNWDLVLSNLWITVEQLTDFIWNKIFLKGNDFHPLENILGRKSSFQEDNRTWSTSVKQEILFQAKIIDDEIISKLFPARKARNKLVHEGKSVPKDIAVNLFKSIHLLLEKAVLKTDQPLSKIGIDSWESKMDVVNYDDDYFTDWKESKTNPHSST